MSTFLKQLDVANDFLYDDVDEHMPLELQPYVEPTKSIQVCCLARKQHYFLTLQCKLLF